MTFQTNKNHPNDRGDLSNSEFISLLCSIWLGVQDSNLRMSALGGCLTTRQRRIFDLATS